jgi:hypothetical protein
LRSGVSSGLLPLPLFTVRGFLVLHSMSAKFVAGADPFAARYGARLGTLDTVSTFVIPRLYFMALKHRRKVHLHARYMLGTVFFLIVPIVGRLLPILPPWRSTGRRICTSSPCPFIWRTPSPSRLRSASNGRLASTAGRS